MFASTTLNQVAGLGSLVTDPAGQNCGQVNALSHLAADIELGPNWAMQAGSGRR
jgi:hypothetical protein